MNVTSTAVASQPNNQIDPGRTDIYQPTHEEIQAACLAIQREWTEAERSRRSRGQAGRQRVPSVSSKRFATIHIESSVLDRRSVKF